MLTSLQQGVGGGAGTHAKVVNLPPRAARYTAAVSRKREQQRENKKELARQLGTTGKDVPQNLLENERVTNPRLSSPSLVVVDIERGFFQKKLLATLRWCLWVKDPSGARFIGDAVCDVVLAKGDVAVVVTADNIADEVRYRRPGSFFVGAVVGEGDVPVEIGDEPVIRVLTPGVYVATNVMEIKAVDRVRELVRLPLVSADGRLRASLTLDVRL